MKQEEVLPCPKGMFCPHKVSAGFVSPAYFGEEACLFIVFNPQILPYLSLLSLKTATPKIQCSECPEEALAFERAGWGYAVVFFMFFFPLVYIFVRAIKRYNKDRLAHFMELASRRMDSMRAKSIRGKRQEQLKNIKPQLDLIAGRLKALANEQDQLERKGSGDASEASNIIVSSKRLKESVQVHTDGTVTFDASLLFDELDTSRDGVLSYTELNQILELDPVQLTEFVRRMNERERASSNSSSTVSRRTFVRHFVNVLAESSNFRPSKEEAEDLFDEIAEQGTNRYGAVEPEKFYTSSLSTFLSDTQINNLLVRLRGHQAAQPARSTRTLLEGADGGCDNTSRAIRRESDNTSRAIRRETFVKQYPRLLIEIATDPDALPMLSTRPGGGIAPADLDMGVDITFEDLSLTVAVGDFSVNVVDKVTGRLRAGTMVSTRMIDFRR
jgi:Ca2+-binding EF-hand superfamily protein